MRTIRTSSTRSCLRRAAAGRAARLGGKRRRRASPGGSRSCRSRRGRRCRSARRAASAFDLISSSLTSLVASLVGQRLERIGDLIRLTLRRAPPIWNILDRLVSSSMPGGAIVSICGASSETSISTSLVELAFCAASSEIAGASRNPSAACSGCSLRAPEAAATSSSRSSATSAASRTLRASASRVCLTAASARSRMIVSTSRPTYPDFGELRRLDLDEGRIGQAREPARDLGLADAGQDRSSGCSSA